MIVKVEKKCKVHFDVKYEKKDILSTFLCQPVLTRLVRQKFKKDNNGVASQFKKKNQLFVIFVQTLENKFFKLISPS